MEKYPAGDLEPTRIAVWRMTFNEQSWLLNTIQFLLGTLGGAENWEQEGNVTTDDAAALGIECIYTFYPAVDMLGTILPFGGSTPPTGSLLCNGASYLRSDYPDLFGIIGTTYGSVDATHFNVPDLRGRTIVATGQGAGLTNRVLASTFGEENHVLTIPETPIHTHIQDPHTHTTIPHTHTEIIALPSAATLALVPIPSAVPAPGATGLSGVTVNAAIATNQNAGSGNAHNTMQPSIALTYIIVAVHG